MPAHRHGAEITGMASSSPRRRQGDRLANDADAPPSIPTEPSTDQRAMDFLFRDLDFVRVYLDDIIVFSGTSKENIAHLSIVFDRIASFNLKLKVFKCEFVKSEVVLLGQVVSSEGVNVDPAKIEKIEKIPTPNSTTELCSFLGLVGYYRRYIKGFATICAPLHEGTSAKKRLAWTTGMNEVFEELKKAMVSPPVLVYPDFGLWKAFHR